MIYSIISAAFLGSVAAQQAGSLTAEQHPALNFGVCTEEGCENAAKSIVLDSNWRWTHKVGEATNCYTGNEWDETLCPDVDTCTANCAIDGADYEGTYGISTSGGALTIKFVTKGQYSTNIGSRVYLMDTDSKYYMFKLLGQEFSFDVDVSQMPCGLNGALYFVEMDEDGGMAKHATNKAGAKYGTGYCDAQCPHDMKFIDGEANNQDWKPSADDPNSGTGHYGTCCNEMDIWEANQFSEAYTPHVCSKDGPTRCEGVDCGDNAAGDRYNGLCDKDGCDFNPWRMGNQTFLGPGANFAVDTTKVFTVTTAFVTDGNGALSEIKRSFTQGGNTINNPMATNIPGSHDSVTGDFCDAQKTTFGDKNDFKTKGGLAKMGAALERGMVLVMSMWDDHDAHMLWLDSTYPTDANATQPGIARGPCSTDSGVPSEVQEKYPDATVVYSNIRVGAIGTTV